MKKILLACLFVLSGTMAFAQFASSKSGSAVTGGDYNRVYGAINLGSLSVDALGTSESTTTYGLTAGFAHGFDITKQQMPLFLEVGGELTYLRASDKYDVDNSGSSTSDAEGSVNMVSLAAPINLTYVFKVGSVDIAPLLGLNLKCNLIASGTYEEKEYYRGELEDTWSTDVNLFDKDDTGGETANRFQIGMNIGCNFTFNDKIVCGYRFQPNFTQLYDNHGVKVSNNVHFFSVGYRF